MSSNKLTPKQEDFCRYYAVENLTQRQAYIAAYGKGNYSDKTIDEAASRLLRNSKVIARCKELKDILVDKVVWSKADMINDLKRIADDCKSAKRQDESIDSKSRAVAVSAIKTAGEMLGYNEKNVNVEVTNRTELSEYLSILKAGNTLKDKDKE